MILAEADTYCWLSILPIHSFIQNCYKVCNFQLVLVKYCLKPSFILTSLANLRKRPQMPNDVNATSVWVYLAFYCTKDHWYYLHFTWKMPTILQKKPHSFHYRGQHFISNLVTLKNKVTSSSLGKPNAIDTQAQTLYCSHVLRLSLDIFVTWPLCSPILVSKFFLTNYDFDFYAFMTIQIEFIKVRTIFWQL